MITNILKKEFILIFFTIGFIGSIVFCPLPMKSGKTCLFHSILTGNVNKVSDYVSVEKRNQILLKRYLVPFGFAWWFSIILLGIGYYQLKIYKLK